MVNTEKASKDKNIRKKIKKHSLLDHHFNSIVTVLLVFMLLLLISSQVEINKLSNSMKNISLDIAEENLILKQKVAEQNEKIDIVKNRLENYLSERITKDQFTEIYMQMQELTGMISEENKREYYINRIVNIISGSNNQLESETIYEIAKHIYEISMKYNFNPLLICALIKVESNFIVDSISDSYAFGLCQVRRFIAKELAENLGIKWDGAEKTLFNPGKNIKIGIYYLSLLYDDFEDMKLALTAYNYGPYKVQELISQQGEIPVNYTDKIFDYYSQYRGFNIEQVDEILNQDMGK